MGTSECRRKSRGDNGGVLESVAPASGAGRGPLFASGKENIVAARCSGAATSTIFSDAPARRCCVQGPAAPGKAACHQEVLSPNEERVAQGRSRAGDTGRRPTTRVNHPVDSLDRHAKVTPVHTWRSALFAQPCSPHNSLRS